MKFIGAPHIGLSSGAKDQAMCNHHISGVAPCADAGSIFTDQSFYKGGRISGSCTRRGTRTRRRTFSNFFKIFHFTCLRFTFYVLHFTFLHVFTFFHFFHFDIFSFFTFYMFTFYVLRFTFFFLHFFHFLHFLKFFHVYMFTCSHVHMFTCSHVHIFTFSRFHIFHIFSIFFNFFHFSIFSIF